MRTDCDDLDDKQLTDRYVRRIGMLSRQSDQIGASMKRRLFITSLFGAAALAFAATPTAFASEGRGPSELCGPPGQTTSVGAKVPGQSAPEAFYGGFKPGQAVKQFCAPGQQP